MCWFDWGLGPNTQVRLASSTRPICVLIRHQLTVVCLRSCNIGEDGICLAEAVHGSAPDIAGKVS